MSILPDDTTWYILVADDDDDSRTLIAATLRRAHMNVCEACDGDELLERFQALSVLVGAHVLVVSDIGMPGTDGIAVTQALREASGDVPIVLMTGFTDEHILQAAQDAGADVVLPKPVNQAELLHTVEQVVMPTGAWRVR